MFCVNVDESVIDESEQMMVKQQTLWMLCVACVVSIVLISLMRMSGDIQNSHAAVRAPALVSHAMPATSASGYDDGFRAGYNKGTSDGQANCNTNNPNTGNGDQEYQRGYRDGYIKGHSALCGS